MLPQLCTLLSNQMQQQLQLQREQDKRHQEMMQFLLTLETPHLRTDIPHQQLPFLSKIVNP